METKRVVITGLTDEEVTIAMEAAEKAVKADREQKEAESKLKQIKDLVREVRALGYRVEGAEIGGGYESRRRTSFTADELRVSKSYY